ncbi:LysM peptidoglycan-binding domain-containing protein [Aeromicrobium tamlense]|uniref:LysM peptidoglycan-binding domain-containing protein n=1 Tax=Aeromicrobium tamlense TaxID=375541 RepID=A0A8I0FXI3_9ACTN|nr:LysM peptidoglycan-binding domain-containing protein [Aeromicrobium tamlense]MBD1270781.1 LysM peptidoglycan-binding domain-containing protein [Aeromicrobium tamlense]NYI38173.1 nucleoid-associated protein YgaU [Aeromicrobium tamlense]
MTGQRLRGLAATLAIVVLVAGVPVLMLAIGATPSPDEVIDLPSLLTRRDDGTLALLLLTLAVWAAWAVVAATLVTEIVAQIRGFRIPALPGLALPQQTARKLVTVAALAFIATPGTVPTLPVPATHAAVPVPRLDAEPPAAAPTAPPPREADPPAAEHVEPDPPTTTYTTRRGDSLWKIAQQLLGDGTRYAELIDLNHDVLGDRPDFLPIGLALRVPMTEDTHARRTAGNYAVQAGDTLWDIADRELGDPERYREIFDASTHIAQPDGGRLTDPDLIMPGWTLALPATGGPAARDPATQKHTDPSHPDDSQHETGPTRSPHSVEQTTEAVIDVTPSSTPSASVADGEGSSGWLVPGLAAGGTVLAGCLFLALRALRRAQLRYRRPGQVLAPTPTDLQPTEKTAVEVGAGVARTLEFLDRALRHLAAEFDGRAEPHPKLERVSLTAETLDVHLAEPATIPAPAPWSARAGRWTLTTGADIPDIDTLPPYPLLVSVGQSDAGALELLNLERFGSIDLTGDTERVDALARHLVAELALSPWSVLVEVHTVGIASELQGLDDLRLHHHAEAVDIRALVDQIRVSHAADSGDPDPFRVVIAASGIDVGELRDLVAAPAQRLGVAVVAMGSSARPAAMTLQVDSAGRLRIDGSNRRLQAAGLTTSEATTCAAIVDAARQTPTVPVPVFEDPVDDLQALIDQAGAVREDLVQPRPSGPAGDRSLLPDTTADYADAAATTAEDVAELAPIIPQDVAEEVLDADPDLDRDLAAWRDPEARLPKLTVLGPVALSAHGSTAPSERRRPVLLELAAYIALHPEGVVSRELAEVFRRSESRMRNDVRDLRAWLGSSPITGLPHLPAGDASRLYQETGTPGYQVDDLLVDLELFRRLRARGHARGAEGLDDLLAALRLVTGPPFALPSGHGWSWLYDDNRIHETAATAIADVAHLVVARTMTEGNIETARAAAQIACSAIPFDEVCQLDLLKVAFAEGHTQAATEMLDRDVLNRTDEYIGTVEPPDRTRTITSTPDWKKRRTS